MSCSGCSRRRETRVGLSGKVRAESSEAGALAGSARHDDTDHDQHEPDDDAQRLLPPEARIRSDPQRVGQQGEEKEQHTNADQNPCPLHGRLRVSYLITSSARCSNAAGIVAPRALAVFSLTTSSNFEGCSMGRLPGGVPFKILSTKVAARRPMSAKSGPYDMRPPDSAKTRSQ